MAASWLALEAGQKAAKDRALHLDRPFEHKYATGESVQLKTVDEAINRVINTFSKPNASAPPQN